VGVLSAAAIHGAAHQQPMIFQVVTDKPTRPAEGEYLYGLLANSDEKC